MLRFIVRWIVLTVALYLTIRGGEQLGLAMQVTDDQQLILGAAALGIVNSLIAPGLHFAACALNCLTLGLASFLINVLLFWGVGRLGLGFTLGEGWRGFGAAMFGSVVCSILVGLLSSLLPEPMRSKHS